MSLMSSIKDIFFSDKKTPEACLFPLVAETWCRALALETCVGFIANALSACEFQTIEKGVAVKKDMYYALNVRPNVNHSAGEFWHKLISSLVKNGEALIIQQDKGYFIADSFAVKEYTLLPNIYEGVTVGDLKFDKTFNGNDVLHMRLGGVNLSRVLNGMYDSYSKMLSAAQSIYKRKNSMRMALNLATNRSQDTQSQAALESLLNEQFGAWFAADAAGAVIPLQQGLSLEDFTDNTKTGNANSRDARELVNDIFDMTAIALHIPPGLIRGDTADLEDRINLFLMAGLKPIVEIVKDEANAKLYTKEEYLSRSYIRVDTAGIRATDISKLAEAANKLFAAGVNTINDNLKMFDREGIDAWWADARFVTKNYSEIESYLKGGEKVGVD